MPNSKNTQVFYITIYPIFKGSKTPTTKLKIIENSSGENGGKTPLIEIQLYKFQIGKSCSMTKT